MSLSVWLNTTSRKSYRSLSISPRLALYPIEVAAILNNKIVAVILAKWNGNVQTTYFELSKYNRLGLFPFLFSGRHGFLFIFFL